MSWQIYIDGHIMQTKEIQQSVICGHDGNVWAKSKDFNVDPADLKALLAKFHDIVQLGQYGVTISGVKYNYLSSDYDRSIKVVRAKKGQSGLHCVKTQQTLILCVYGEPTMPEKAATIAEKVGDHLVTMGF